MPHLGNDHSASSKSTGRRSTTTKKARRGSIEVGRRNPAQHVAEDQQNETKQPENVGNTSQDYDHMGHYLALHILHSTPSQARRHLQYLGAAEGLPDHGSDTESDLMTDDENEDVKLK